MEIITKRLILRAITHNDAEDVFDYSKGPGVGPNAGWKPHKSIEETRRIMEEVFLDKDGVFAIALKEAGRVIGSIGLVDDPKRQNEKARMLGYALGETFWGWGYMSEAAEAAVDYGFSVMKLDIISAYCYPFNLRSIRVLDKLGFKHEGRLRLCETRYDGNIYDNECYSLTSDDYFRKKAQMKRKKH